MEFTEKVALAMLAVLLASSLIIAIVALGNEVFKKFDEDAAIRIEQQHDRWQECLDKNLYCSRTFNDYGHVISVTEYTFPPISSEQ